ncbi:MAG: hypothetical protein JNL58_25605 [Planctomyces sp.]|nr:hypothetical protein [Planctomyces sp.]
MLKTIPAVMLFGILLVGCDSAVRREQAEQARREAQSAELKELGNSMHESGEQAQK